MAPNLTPEQIDELESRGLMTPTTSQSMRSQMMSEMENTPKPILDKVLMDTMSSREQDNADTIPNKIAEDAANNPELKDIVERTSMRLQELTRDPTSIGATPGQRWNAGVANNASTSGITPPPPPVDRISNPAVLPPPAQEKSLVAEKSPAQQAGQMQLDALEMKERAAMMRAGQEQRAGNAQAGFLENTAAKLQEVEDNRLRERADLERRRNEQLSKVEQAQAKYDTMQIDPNQFYGSRTTEQNVLLNLGLALSVFGGNTKEYTDNIYKAIDRDIDVQKEQIKLQGNKVTGARNVLSDMMDVTQDVDKAADLAKAGMLKQAELKGAAMAARVSNADAKAKLLDTVADLNMKRAEILSKVTSVESIDQQLAYKSIKGGLPILDDGTLASLIKEVPKEDLPVVTITGLGLAKSPTDAEKVKKIQGSYKNLTADLNRLAELRALQNNALPGIFPSKYVDEGRAISARMMNEGRVMSDAGTLDASALEVFGRLMPPDPLSTSLNPVDLVRYGIKRTDSDPLLSMINSYRDGTRQTFSSVLEGRMRGVVPSAYQEIVAPGKGADLRSKLKEVETPKGVR